MQQPHPHFFFEPSHHMAQRGSRQPQQFGGPPKTAVLGYGHERSKVGKRRRADWWLHFTDTSNLLTIIMIQIDPYHGAHR
ncbi:MAG: hypothetical protein U1E07_19290 [Hydrocarboniphaga sp.]|nr:hypothetical protein [Hydrocarboniphaga effusa]MDZ4080560.1 hypothetical protein [Hydrocarboniphaga sp.]